MMQLTFAASYMAPPLFNHNLESLGHVELEDLNLPNDLVIDIKNWDQKYQATFDSHYPLDSHFKSKECQTEFDREGKQLYMRLKEVLGGSAFVEYITSTLPTAES